MALEETKGQHTSDPKTVLCFGDSLTWGFDPRGGTNLVRYGFTRRWTRQLQAELGTSYHIVENGLNGRTTVFDDPVLGDMSGLAQLPIALKSNMPLDLVIILLGSNDAKTRFNVNGDEIARGLSRLLEVVSKSSFGPNGIAPSTLVLIPPEMGEVGGTWLETMFDPVHSRAALQRIRETYPVVASAFGAECFDINQVVGPGAIDGIHFDPKALTPIAKELAIVVRDLLKT
ncbi:MAG: GDSL-type esterase/lipase family protein [Pseudomonadota bacterium]